MVFQNGASAYSVIWPANATAVQVKSVPGKIIGIRTFNIAAAPAYLKLFDSLAGPTVGTTVPSDRVGIPGSTTGAGNNSFPTDGWIFQNGLWVVVTTGITDDDTGAPSASNVLVTIFFE